MLCTDYSESKVIDCVNSDLVNTLGNLLNRVTGTVINPSQSLPPFDRQVFDRHGMPVDRTMLQTLSSLPSTRYFFSVFAKFTVD